MLAKPVIKPEGVGDLLVLKQQIARYEAGEVAHIENVLGRELRARSHRMFRQTVDRFEEEKERIEENLRDLQSTERFELENEIERTVRSESAFQAGAELSGGFGPVSVSAYARTSSSRAREEARRNATRYAKEIVERATSKLIDRTQSRRATVTTEEVEENNKHEFDNRESGEHVVGIYRWVDKFCRMKMVNYGRRLFYQFIVPEPAALFRYLSEQNATRAGPPKPRPPVDPENPLSPLRPDHVTAETYLGLVALYEVRDVNPPPPATVIITKEFSAVFDTSTSFEVAIDDFEVPTGYVAQSFTLSQNGFSGDWTTEDAFIIVSGTHRYLRDGDFYSDLDGESDKVPIVLCGKGWSLLMLGCTVDLECAVAPEFLLRGSSTPTQKSSPPTRSLNSTTRSGCAPMKSSRCGDRWP